MSYSQVSPMVFKHLTVEDGLSQSTVHAIFQDRSGFMWFGTDIGLNKYDGNKFTEYQNSVTDTNSIASNFIVDIFEDSYGNFWVANGYNGLDLFDRKNEKFIHYKNNKNNPGSISNNNIRAVFEDSRHNLWVGTSGGGLNLYNRKNNSFTHFKNNPQQKNSIKSNFISAITEDKSGNIWIGSTEGVLSKLNIESGVFTNYSLFDVYYGDIYNTTFGSVYIDSEDNVWYGTESGLFLYEQKSGKFTHYTKGNSNKGLNVSAISSVLEIEKGIYIIATDHGGLNVLNKQTGTFTYLLNNRNDLTTISNNQLYSIYKSPDGIVWIGSFHGGLNIYDKKATKFSQYRYISKDNKHAEDIGSVLSICEDKDKNIWIGSDGQGIDIYNPKTQTSTNIKPILNNKNSIPSSCITEIYKDRQDNLWIGTYLEGFSIYDWITKKYTHYKHEQTNDNSLAGNNIWSILEDSKGQMWLGTIGSGLDLFDRTKQSFTHFKSNPNSGTSLTNNDVFKVFEAKDGVIWVGTRNGLNKLKNGSDKFYHYFPTVKDSSSLCGSWVYEIFQDSKNNLWVGTDLGLNMYQPKTNNFKHFTEKNGLKGKAILGILEDNKHNLWISTNNGLTKFDPETNTFRNYDVSDGLQGNEFNYTSYLLSSDGKMYFGGKNGFNVFKSDSIKDNSLKPAIFFTGFKVSDGYGNAGNEQILTSNINFTKKIVLSYRHTVISFEFAVLNYTNPSRNKYAYTLDGFDPQWNYIGNKHEITYTNLDPGRYTLRIKGANNDGVWNEIGTSVEIIVTPPFWKTSWFYIIEVILVFIAIYLYVLSREIRLQRDKKFLTAKIQERTIQIELQKEELEQHRHHLEKLIIYRTEELIAAKERAEESDQLKSAFLANMSHEIRTPMNAIVGFSNLLNLSDLTEDEKKQYIALINANSEALMVLIEDILDLSLIEANQIVVRKQEFGINDMVETVYSSMAVNNKKPMLKIELNNLISHVNMNIYSDKFRMKQILSNLMNNAYKFTDAGKIVLSVEVLCDDLVFLIQDTGIGIPEDNLHLIFDRFRKLECNSSTSYRGAGLGLAISKKLADLLGGKLTVTSDLGVGSSFKLIIPLNTV